MKAIALVVVGIALVSVVVAAPAQADGGDCVVVDPFEPQVGLNVPGCIEARAQEPIPSP